MARDKALVVCPGRGTYNRAELGYLHRHHAGRGALIERFDRRRAELGQPTLSELDGAPTYSPAIHGRGDNASGLIFACSYADYLAIDRDRFDIVAVTGNSMGWYSALACGGALDADHGFEVVNAMGTRMHRDGVGGQIVHSLLDEDWRPIAGRREAFQALVGEIPDLHVSIQLGGMIVFAGTDEALDTLARHLPSGPGSFPMRLQNHAAFHTPLLEAISVEARRTLPAAWFESPTIPLIDGRGRIWRPHASDASELWDYTFGHQVTRTYDFTAAIRVAMREFAPDRLIILGPGETLGGAVIQSLLAIKWHGWDSKRAFQVAQAEEAFVLSCGRADQRGLIA